MKRKYKSTTTSNPTYRVITLERPDSVAAEAYRRIKVGLEFANVDEEVKVVQVTSSVQGEGKTIMALNLAATYAEAGQKVLLVDLDLRRPKIHRSFKVENKDGDGLTDLLAGKISKEQAIKHSESGIDFINRGSKTSYPTSLLGSDALANLFAEFRKEYDYIIVDCAPILAVSDAAIISKLTDGALFVVSQLKTEKAAAKEAISILKQNNVNILGCVYTGINSKNNDYYSSKYKYYYQDYGKDNH